MTNEQLAVLLSKYIARLEAEIVNLDRGLPDSVERRKNTVPGQACPILDGLDVLCQEMQEDLALLTSNARPAYTYFIGPLKADCDDNT